MAAASASAGGAKKRPLLSPILNLAGDARSEISECPYECGSGTASSGDIGHSMECCDCQCAQTRGNGSVFAFSGAPPRSSRKGHQQNNQRLRQHQLQRSGKRAKTTNVTTLRRVLATKSLAAIRLTPHKQGHISYTAVEEVIPSESADSDDHPLAHRLFFGRGRDVDLTYGGRGGNNGGGRTLVWTMDGPTASRWIRAALAESSQGRDLSPDNDADSTSDCCVNHHRNPEPLYVHPVAYDGPTPISYGGRGRMYAHAGVSQMEAELDGGSRMLTLRYQTYLAGVAEIKP